LHKIGWLEKENCNAISVDWSALATGDPYEVAEFNSPIVGATLAAFVDFLVQKGASIKNIHLVGFSMGVYIFKSFFIQNRISNLII